MIKQVLIAVDQLANTLAGGMADETLSARCWRLRARQPWQTFRGVVDTLFFFDRDHCRTSYESELERKQLPGEYRRAAN